MPLMCCAASGQKSLRLQSKYGPMYPVTLESICGAEPVKLNCMVFIMASSLFFFLFLDETVLLPFMWGSARQRNAHRHRGKMG